MTPPTFTVCENASCSLAYAAVFVSAFGALLAVLAGVRKLCARPRLHSRRPNTSGTPEYLSAYLVARDETESNYEKPTLIYTNKNSGLSYMHEAVHYSVAQRHTTHTQEGVLPPSRSSRWIPSIPGCDKVISKQSHHYYGRLTGENQEATKSTRGNVHSRVGVDAVEQRRMSAASRPPSRPPRSVLAFFRSAFFDARNLC